MLGHIVWESLLFNSNASNTTLASKTTILVFFFDYVRKRCKICSKLTITQERRQPLLFAGLYFSLWTCEAQHESRVFISAFEPTFTWCVFLISYPRKKVFQKSTLKALEYWEYRVLLKINKAVSWSSILSIFHALF